MYTDVFALPIGEYDVVVIRWPSGSYAESQSQYAYSTAEELRKRRPNWRGIVLGLPHGFDIERCPIEQARSLHQQLGAYLAQYDAGLTLGQALAARPFDGFGG